MNDNTTLLQKEIERLNFIISLLIEKNRELERKLQSISLQNTSPRRPFLSDQENREELNTTNGSILPQAELINGEIHNPSVKAIESNQSAYSNVKELEQLNQFAYSNVKELEQSNQSAYSNVKELEPSNQSAYSNVKELEQSNQSAEPKSSTDIDINMVHPENIYRLLRKKMPRAKRAAAHHAALTLIHLYKKNENTHHELSKVTGLTPRGTGKHIMMLKRRGYIV